MAVVVEGTLHDTTRQHTAPTTQHHFQPNPTRTTAPNTHVQQHLVRTQHTRATTPRLHPTHTRNNTSLAPNTHAQHHLARRYVIYTSIEIGHRPSIERLSPDFTNTTRQNSGLLPFPSGCYESPLIFSRGSDIYALSAPCCCNCVEGSTVQALRSTTGIFGSYVRSPHRHVQTAAFL
jgi:hypothetical protein